MNKQELIEAVIELLVDCSGSRPKIDKLTTLELIKLLDEPEKVVVPQFVADWYEENKDDFEFNVWDWTTFRDEPEKLENKEFNYWINDGEGNPIQTLVNMHQFGYEVEKEPKYTVKIKSTKCSTISLVFSESTDVWLFSATFYQGLRFKHTQKQLEEAGFGEVFNSPLFEVEEVEE